MICWVSSLVGATIRHYTKSDTHHLYQYNTTVYVLSVLHHVSLEVEPVCAPMLGGHTIVTVSIIWNKVVVHKYTSLLPVSFLIQSALCPPYPVLTAPLANTKQHTISVMTSYSLVLVENLHRKIQLCIGQCSPEIVLELVLWCSTWTAFCQQNLRRIMRSSLHI